MLSVDRCTGCSACVSICPNGCLSLIENAEGFDYPVLDSSKCTKCNLCEKVCPINHETPSTKNTYTICAQNRNEKIRSKSSAGGIIGAIYQAAFSSCGIAFGVGFNSENNVMFMSAENLDQCFEKKLFASKYVSAEITNTFPKVRDILISGRVVCFVGLPCQVAGLRSYLGRDYDNLWLIDLTCYGVPSRKLYRKYINFLENKYREKITDVRFRDKSFGYSAPTMSVELASGKIISQNSSVKSYLRCFFKNISSRPSCYNCHFKTVDRISDLTVGDMKSIYKFVPTMDDDLGTTVLYIHSEKGRRIVETISESLVTAEVPLDSVLFTSGKKMISCPSMNPVRDKFFSDIDKYSYEKLISKYCSPDVSEFAANIMKSVLKAIGLNRSGIIKAIKRRKG